MLRRNGIRYRDMEERGFFYVVARIGCRFRAPAGYDEVLTLTTTTEKLTRVRVEHSYRLLRGDQLLAEADSVLVCVGRNGRPTGLPDDIFERLAGVAAETRAD